LFLKALCLAQTTIWQILVIISIIIINNVLTEVTLSCRRCRGTLQSHNNSEEGIKKLAKTEPKQICLQLPKGGEG